MIDVIVDIDPELRSLIPPLAEDERALLEANILRDGCRDPLVVWNGVLLDGHHRFDICRTHGLSFETVIVDLESRQAAEDWIDTNQLGRRNLTPDQASLLRGRRYNRTKQTGFRQNDGNAQTAERLATQHGVSPRTIERDAQFADAVETLKPVVPNIEQRVLAGDVPSKQAVVEAAREPQHAEQILGKAHVSHNSGNNEWYTPTAFIDAARAAMGKIDCDPASSTIANKVVSAETFYTVMDDGLSKPWRGNVWMNPPYAQPLIAQFSDALAEKFERREIKRACVLVNNATETAWFQRMLVLASAVCFVRSRVRFLDPSGDPSGAPLQGQVVLYLGENPYRFSRGFADLGHVLVREKESAA